MTAQTAWTRLVIHVPADHRASGGSVVVEDGDDCKPVIVDDGGVDNWTSPPDPTAGVLQSGADLWIEVQRTIVALIYGDDPEYECYLPWDETFIHTSHTIQDFVNIDTAWLRSSNKIVRKSDCSIWASVENDNIHDALAGVGPSWWSVTTDPTWQDMNFWCAFSRCVQLNIVFWTDFEISNLPFAHCGLVPGSVDQIRLVTGLYPKIDGSYTVDFQKYGSCPGLKSSTAHRESSNLGGRYEGDGVHRCVTWDRGMYYC